MNRKKIVDNIVDTLKGFDNWEVQYLFIENNCIYATVKKIINNNLTYEIEGIYAASDFDKNDCNIMLDMLLKALDLDLTLDLDF